MSHIVFILIYYTDCERNKTYHLNSNIRRIMSTNSITARHQSFADISKPSHMWRWLEHDLRELIFSDHSHNLGSSIIIGNATKLEQVLLLAWYRILLQTLSLTGWWVELRVSLLLSVLRDGHITVYFVSPYSIEKQVYQPRQHFNFVFQV